MQTHNSILKSTWGPPGIHLG